MGDFREHYVRGLGTSVRNNALAYGYSIMATSSFGMLAHTDGPITVLHIFMFVIGNSVAYAAVNALVTRGFRQRVEPEPPVVMALATSLSVISISAGVGTTALLGSVLGGWVAWLLAGLISTWLFLSIGALEMALSRNLHLRVADEAPEER